MDPIASEEASYEENELENRVVFPACAVTLATKRTLAEEVTLFACLRTGPSLIDLWSWIVSRWNLQYSSVSRKECYSLGG
jgi:hypothetical protein